MTQPRRWKDPESEAPQDVQSILRDHHAEPRAIPRPAWERAEPARRGLDLRWVAVAAAAAAILLWVGLRTPSERRDPTHALTGVVAQGSVSSQGRTLAKNDKLGLPISIQTKEQAAVLTLGDGDRLELSPQGSFTLTALPECSPCLTIHSGSAKLEALARSAQASPLMVQADPWRVRVLGTRFSVERHAPHDIRVEVERGEVLVEGPRPPRRVKAGQHFDSRDRAKTLGDKRAHSSAQATTPTPSERTPPRPEQATTNRAEQRRPESNDATETAPRAARERRAREAEQERRAREAAEQARDQAAREAEQQAAEQQAAEQQAAEQQAAEQQAAERSARELAPAPVSTSRKAGDERAPSPPALTPDASPVAPKERQLELLRQARQAKDPVVALAALDTAAALGPPFAEVASYRAARISLSRATFGDAARRLRSHILVWPTGELAEVAHLDLIEAELRRGKTKSARAELQRILRRFPKAASGAPLQFLHGELARADKAWAEAALYYARAAGVPEFAPRALFLEALSQARSGNRSKARQKMTAYLERFPNGPFAEQARKALGEEQDTEGAPQ